jgi:hypothetical protein
MSQGRSSSFIGLPRELFAAEFKKSVLKAANSGKDSSKGERRHEKLVAASATIKSTSEIGDDYYNSS